MGKHKNLYCIERIGEIFAATGARCKRRCKCRRGKLRDYQTITTYNKSLTKKKSIKKKKKVAKDDKGMKLSNIEEENEVEVKIEPVTNWQFNDEKAGLKDAQEPLPEIKEEQPKESSKKLVLKKRSA